MSTCVFVQHNIRSERDEEADRQVLLLYWNLLSLSYGESKWCDSVAKNIRYKFTFTFGKLLRTRKVILT